MRAYFNALRLAAEGGHDFSDTFDALEGKIRGCMDALKQYAQYAQYAQYGSNKYIYGDDDVENKFLDVISQFIEKTTSALDNAENTNTISSEGYKGLVKDWKSFETDVRNAINPRP